MEDESVPEEALDAVPEGILHPAMLQISMPARRDFDTFFIFFSSLI
jgi:hypothetical protein